MEYYQIYTNILFYKVKLDYNIRIKIIQLFKLPKLYFINFIY